MAITVDLTFDFEEDDYAEFLARPDVQGDLNAWIFGELCQNQGFGFLSDMKVTKS